MGRVLYQKIYQKNCLSVVVMRLALYASDGEAKFDSQKRGEIFSLKFLWSSHSGSLITADDLETRVQLTLRATRRSKYIKDLKLVSYMHFDKLDAQGILGMVLIKIFAPSSMFR